VALQARKANRELFLRGDYEAIPSGRHVVAFTRGFETSRLVCAVVRHSYVGKRGATAHIRRGDRWGDEALAVPTRRIQKPVHGCRFDDRRRHCSGELFAELSRRAALA